MTYADPHACPACRGAISGGANCPHCGFGLGSEQAGRLWSLFLEADRLIAEGRAQQHPTPVSAASPDPRPDAPAAPVVPASVSPPRSWSTGSILLGLGAVCLIVAAIIFATVAWGSLGILGRALILLAVTGIVGGAAAWATTRRLFGTAEALWAVFLGLITVDVLAAVAEGLFGLEWGDFPFVSVVWTAVIAGAGTTIVRWARSAFLRDLVMPQLAAGLAPWISAPAVALRLGDELGGSSHHWFWGGLVAIGIPIIVLVLARRLSMRWTFVPAVVLVVGFAVVLVIIAVVTSLDGTPLLTLSEALPTLVLALGAAAGAQFVPGLRAWLAGCAKAAGLFLITVACCGWAWHADVSIAAGLVALSISVALIAWIGRGQNDWHLGARWAAVVGGGVLLVWGAGLAVANLERIDRAEWLASPVDVWVGPTDLTFTEGAWVVAVFAPLLLAWWGARRWTSPTLAPETWWTPLGLVVAGAAVVTAVAASTLPFLAHASTLVAVGAVLAVGLRRAPWAFSLVPPAIVGLAMVVIPMDAAVTAWAWGFAALGFAVCAGAMLGDPHSTFGAGFRVERPSGRNPAPKVGGGARGDGEAARRAVSAVSAGLGAAAAIATVGQAVDLVGAEPGWWGTIVGGVAAATLLLTLALDDVPWHRLAIEIVAGLALLVALASEADHLATVSLLFTIGAVAAVVVGLLDDDRTYLRWVGAGLVGAAWVARLAASDVETVEAYTAPFAVTVLAAGVWRLRTRPEARTWSVLTPGLTLALLPSLPQALDDPTSLRAGLLALVAAAVLAVGLVLRWGAPVVLAAAVLLLIVLANVGPTALALQRWILIAIAGLVLLVIGTTWEKRVAEGRALVARIAALR